MPIQKFDIDVLSSNIKMLLHKKGVTQNNLASAIGLSNSALSKRMNGNPGFYFKEIFDIAQYFHVSIDALCNSSLPDTIKESKTDTEHSNEEKLLLHSDAAIYKVCAGLAAVFKYTSCLMVETKKHSEVVFEEDVDEYGRPTGFFCQKKYTSGENPANEYASLFFSNYWPISSGPFEPEVDPDDYFADLVHTGNYNMANYKINRFLKKLVDLHTTYENGSIKYEYYCQAIDNLLGELPKTPIIKAKVVGNSDLPE